MVLVWNANAVSVIERAATADPPGLGQGPPLSAFHLAMVQGAIYDAVNAIDRGHEPYLHGLSAPSTAYKEAAVAQAAHDVLFGLTNATHADGGQDADRRLAGRVPRLVPAGTARRRDQRPASRSVPRRRPRCSLARATDGRNVDRRPLGHQHRSRRVAAGPPLSNNVAAHFDDVTPLTIKSPDQFITEGPPALTSAQYATEFNEVKAWVRRPARPGRPLRPCSPASSARTRCCT